MLIKLSESHPIEPTEITPEAVYAERRRFLVKMGLATAALALARYEPAAAAVDTNLASLNVSKKRELAGGETVTAYEDITHYNNFYEYVPGKEDPARIAGRLRTRPWSVLVDGECEAPGRIDLEDLINPRALEERIDRHRCVEAWSMVAPWIGAPLRLTVPWKYGFKSIKSIVHVRFMQWQPDATWNQLAPQEYGFYSNVNPSIDHPRWSQAKERRLGELVRRNTPPFNGYPEVASLYSGMDLRRFF